MTDPRDARIAELEAQLATAQAELERRTTERDYHLSIANILAEKLQRPTKRPVAFRVKWRRDSNEFELFSDEEGAQAAASDRGVDYDGLYLVGDRYAATAQADTREIAALDEKTIFEIMRDEWDEICSDTNCHPLDIQQLGQRKLGFSPNHWASAIAGRLRTRSASPAIPAQEEPK